MNYQRNPLSVYEYVKQQQQEKLPPPSNEEAITLLQQQVAALMGAVAGTPVPDGDLDDTDVTNVPNFPLNYAISKL